jgi:hypothetical protein
VGTDIFEDVRGPATGARSTYSLDSIFLAQHSNQFIYDSQISSIVQDFIRGYNATVFAYGQSGSGM